MKTIDFEINGRVLHLCLNGTAWFDLQDIFGPEKNLIEHILPGTGKGYNATCLMLAKLAEQGELVRQYQGYEPEKPFTVRELRALMKPTDVLRAKLAIKQAIEVGLELEEKRKKPKRRDRGLEKLRAKENGGAGIRRGEYIRLLVRELGLTIREGLMLTPGQVMDQLTLQFPPREDG